MKAYMHENEYDEFKFWHKINIWKTLYMKTCMPENEYDESK